MLVAPEMISRRVGIDLQDFGHVLGAPAGGKQHHGFDAVGLTLVSGRAVGGPKFGELVGAKRVVIHAGKGT